MPVDMKSVIASTFASMAKKTGIDKITVKALIAACNISRQTVYYHFQDIMDVVEWSIKQATKDMLSRSLEAQTPVDALNVFVSSVAENHELVRKLMDSQKRGQIERLFVQATRTYLEELARNRAPSLSLKYSDMEIALDFWSFGIAGLLFKYCSQERVDTKKLAEQICRLLPKSRDSSAS